MLRTVLLLSLLASIASPAPGQPTSDKPIAQELQEMREEMEQLRVSNREMMSEIRELRSSSDDAWLTEQRADEIRALVTDVLADADSRASFQNGLTAGWSEHFFLASPDGRFKLELDGQMQVRWVFNHHDIVDKSRHGFEVTRTQLTMRGHVFSPDFTYLVRTDSTRNEPGLVEGLYFVRDIWFGMQLTNNWTLRAGQFKLPFNREELVSSSYQLAVERSLVNESLNQGRSQGVELTYADETDKLMFAASDGAADSIGGFAIIGINPPNTPWSDELVEWAVTGRWEHLFAGDWRQFKDFTSPPGEEFGMLFGLGVHAQRGESNGSPSPNRNEDRLTSVTGDLSFEWGGASLFISGLYSFIDTLNPGQIHVAGFVAQGGMYITEKVELFLRYEHGFWDLENFEFPDLNVITFGFNYYLDGHDMKWSTDLGFGIGEVDGAWDANISGYRPDIAGADPQVVFRTQFQLLF